MHRIPLDRNSSLKIHEPRTSTLPLVYVAGPLTSHPELGEFECVGVAMDAADYLRDAGIVPYIPHLTMHCHVRRPRPYDYWLEEEDFTILDRCDAMIRVPGPSPGSDREAIRMTNRKRPVVFLPKDWRTDLAWLTTLRDVLGIGG